MSIQLECSSVRSNFSPNEGIRVKNEEERLANQKAFLDLIGRECRSADLDLQRDDVPEIIDWGLMSATLVAELSEKEFPELAPLGDIDMFIPCVDPDERFYFDFYFHSLGERAYWKISDMNSLKEWVAKVKEFNRTQTDYDKERLTMILEDYERAIAICEREKCVISMNY